MVFDLVMTQMIVANDDAIQQAGALIRAGNLVAFPTETVYGLGGNALDDKAVAAIFAAKGRPDFNPLIAHVASLREAQIFAHIDDCARALAQIFWPGPLTMILRRRDDAPISELACAGLATIAVRVPAHPVARALIEAAGVPIVAPSANLSGSISPTTPAHVMEGLGNKVDMILAAGACDVGLESTVVDLSGDVPVVLRPGSVMAKEVADVLCVPVGYHLDEAGGDVRSPGQLLRHYAPKTKLRLNAIDLLPREALLGFGSVKFMGIQGGGSAQGLPEEMIRNLSENQDLEEAASNLFAMLRELDKSGAQAIAVMAIPEQGLGIAINDRLRRAAS